MMAASRTPGPQARRDLASVDAPDPQPNSPTSTELAGVDQSARTSIGVVPMSAAAGVDQVGVGCPDPQEHRAAPTSCTSRTTAAK
jgi:hypothetical protein